MTAKTDKKDYVIRVNAPGLCWLGLPSDEDDPNAISTSCDPNMALRYTDFVEALRALREVVKLHPERSFMLDVMPKLA